uniref:MATH domain-containing protein n=1 Tax=Anopheles christyi TaxID=43041 RepID=A0A182K2V3_9DIPT
MENSTIKARLKFSQTSCYLCSEWLDDADVEVHIRNCRQEQTVCPNRCGAIVAQKDLQLHSNTCRRGYGESMETPDEFETAPSEEQSGVELTLEQVIATLEHDINSIQLLQTEQTDMRSGVQAELAHLKKYYDVSQRWTGKVYESIVALYKLNYQEKVQRSLELTALREQLKSLAEWRTHIGNRFDILEKQVFFIMQDRAIVEEEIQSTVACMEEPANTLFKQQHYDDAQPSTSKAGKATLATLPLKEPNSLQLNKPADHTASASSMGVAVEAKGPSKEIMEDFINYQVKLNYDQKDMRMRLFDCEERLIGLETTLKKCRRETYYTKQRTEELQSNMLLATNRCTPASENGHIIWRIENFAQRFQHSKELETMMKGPIFTNQPYGYMLQAEASLFGIGTWRGRNLIAGLTILPGPYDALLEWPARLTATICLRDQATNPCEAQHVYKPIVAKVKGHKDKNKHYVYIPHDVLYANNYVKQDTLFLEVIIAHEQSSGSE